MTSSILVTSKSIVTRTWADVEPKLYAALISGTAVAAVLTIAALVHVAIPPIVVAELPVLAGVLAGYVKASTHKGDLTAYFKANGLGDVVKVADVTAKIAPVTAAPIASAESVLADLGFDPSSATTSLSPVTTSVAVIDPAPAGQ